MRQGIKDLVGIVATTLPVREPIYEFGALQVPGQEQFADLRPLFPGRVFVGADMREGPGVDRILDLHDLDLPDASVGTVLCLDTLEHVEFPRRALAEIHRVLAPDGMALISSVMDFPIHDYPYDYWRFTPEGFRSLLQPFPESFVGFAGRKKFPHTVVGIGFKGARPPLAELEARYEEWRERQRVQAGLHPLKRIVKLLTPPLFSRKYRKALGLSRRSR